MTQVLKTGLEEPSVNYLIASLLYWCDWSITSLKSWNDGKVCVNSSRASLDLTWWVSCMLGTERVKTWFLLWRRLLLAPYRSCRWLFFLISCKKLGNRNSFYYWSIHPFKKILSLWLSTLQTLWLEYTSKEHIWGGENPCMYDIQLVTIFLSFFFSSSTIYGGVGSS